MMHRPRKTDRANYRCGVRSTAGGSHSREWPADVKKGSVRQQSVVGQFEASAMPVSSIPGQFPGYR